MKSFDEKFDAAFSLVAFTVNRHLIRHMQRMQIELEMDLQTTYIWGILAHLNIAGANPANLAEVDLKRSAWLTENLKPISTLSLAQISGIPRETVRRKLELLVKLGKVERDEEKRWRVLQSGVDQHIYEFTKQTVIELLQTASQVNQLLDKQ